MVNVKIYEKHRFIFLLEQDKIAQAMKRMEKGVK